MKWYYGNYCLTSKYEEEVSFILLALHGYEHACSKQHVVVNVDPNHCLLSGRVFPS